jgi:thiol-disulfide isomerase/thioredoxin
MSLNSTLRRGLLPAFLVMASLSLVTGSAQGTGYSPAPRAVPGADEAFEDGPAEAARSLAKGRPQQVGHPATDLRGINAGGAPFDLAQDKGKVILLDVSTMWCVFCQQDAAPLEYLFQTYGPKGLAVITCLTQDVNGAAVTQSGLQQWTSTYHLTSPVFNDASGANGVAEQAYVAVTGGFPTLVLIDKEFNVQYIQGGLDLPSLTAKIQALLAP